MLEALIQNTDGSLLMISDPRRWTKEQKQKYKKLEEIMRAYFDNDSIVGIADYGSFAWALGQFT